MQRLALISCLVIVATVCPLAWGDGELEQLRSGVHTPSPKSPLRKPDWIPSRERSYDDPFEEDPLDEAIDNVVLAALAAPYWIPYTMLDEPRYERFAGYCEEYEASSYKDSEWFFRATDFVCSARAQFEYGTDFSRVQSVGTRLQVDFPRWRSTIDASWNNYYEDVFGGETDHLGLGDVNWVFRFAQHPRTVWRSGVGINWLIDHDDDIGFNFTYGFDVLPIRPIVWSTDFDLGTLGHASLFRVRTTVGVQWLECELYTGFEYVDVEDAQVPVMLFGFRYWW